MNDIERLAVLTAMEKAVKQQLDPLKSDLKDRLLGMEAECGADRMALKLGGDKVGSAYITRSKPQVMIAAGCEGEAVAELSAMGLTSEEPVRGWQSRFGALPSGDVVRTDTGEVVGWAVAVPSLAKGATVKVDLGAVKSKLAAMPPMDVAGLIGGGAE